MAGVPGFEPGLTVLETAVLAANTIPLSRLGIAECGLRRVEFQSEIRIPHSPSLRLFVRSMAPALSAELLELEAIRRLLLVLCRDVIPVLALGALKRNVVSWHNPSSIADFAICDRRFQMF